MKINTMDRLNPVTSELICILCFESLVRPCDRNFVDGRGAFKVLDELNDLPFVVRIDFKHICKHCLGMLKKRNALKKSVEQLDEKLLTDYKVLCAKRGLAVKTRGQVKRSLPFEDAARNNEGLTPAATAVSVTPQAPQQSNLNLNKSTLSTGSSSTRLLIQSLFQSPTLPLLTSPRAWTVGSTGYGFKPPNIEVTPTNTVFSSVSTSSTSRPVPVMNTSSIKQSIVIGSTTSAMTRHEVTKSVSTQTRNMQESAKKQEKTTPRYDEKGRKITDVFVRAEWGSGPREKKLPECLSSLGKMLVRGTYKQIASAAWKCGEVRTYLIKEVLKSIHTECANMCSRKDPSLLRKTSKSEILEFSFKSLGEELNRRAPLFYGILRTASLKNLSGDKSWLPPVGMAAAVCLKNRSAQMTTVQLLVSIILQHSGLTVSNI